ncbi:uncharacterized protein TRIADDRAFT_13189, partial [Trichoplax adhaerens]
ILISTSRGPIRGNVVYGAKGKFSYEFLGIPYAQPPINKLRFKPPVPYSEEWMNPFEATTSPALCPQRSKPFSSSSGLSTQNEDCLYLSIYTPEINTSTLLPVLIWLGDVYNDYTHPSWRSSRRLVQEEEIIVITVSYRRGIFGFLPTIGKKDGTGDDELVYNLALLDQQMALNWIFHTIRDFGGNTEKITLGGYDHGSAMTMLHLLSPNSRGLFQQCLLQSGTPLNENGFHYIEEDRMLDMVLRMANSTGRSAVNDSITETMNEILVQFQNMTMRSLLKMEDQLVKENPSWQFLPVIDGRSIPDKADKMIQQGRFYKANIMIGLSQDSHLALAVTNHSNKSKHESDDSDDFTQHLSRYIDPSSPFKPLIAHAYGRYTDKHGKAPMQTSITYLNTDRNILLPAVFCANHFANFGLSTYFYILDHLVDSSLGDDTSPNSDIPFEMVYLFGNPVNYFKRVPVLNQYSPTLLHQSIKYWSEFIRSGKPNNEIAHWPRYEDSKQPILVISGINSSIHHGYRIKFVHLWNKLLPQISDQLE